MKIAAIILVLAVLAGALGAVAMAKEEDSQRGMDDQARPATGVQEREDVKEQIREEVREQIREQEQVRNVTLSTGATLLREKLREREREVEQEQLLLSAGEQRVQARYRNLSAFVHLLLNESDAASLLGEGSRGIGPQVSAYARDLNASLRAQIQEEARIETRSALVRFFAGGDREAAQALEQEVTRNQDRIRQMQQLILQCQECDSQVRTLLQDQLGQMEEQQTRLRQLALRENQDTGLLGWLWR